MLHYNYPGAGVFKKRKAFFTGTTAVKKGQGLCFDMDYTSTDYSAAATDDTDIRMYRVENPSTTNNLRFAGVAAKSYAANALGQEIEIYEPGGLAMILIGQDTAVPSGATPGTILTCSASATDAGRFTFAGLPGRGTAQALQTNTSGAKFTSIDGSATAAYSGGVTTITKTGIGTASEAGDRVVILGGADDAAGGDASTGEMATVGIYTVASAPTADTITIADDIGDVDVALYVLDDAEQVALAYLYDGEESGLQEFVSPQDAVAVSCMVGGTSFICGGYTMAADSTFTLADTTYPSLKKAFVGLGTLTTSDYAITVTSGLQGDGSTALAGIAIDAANEFAVVEWNGSFGGATAGVWLCKQYAGATLS